MSDAVFVAIISSGATAGVAVVGYLVSLRLQKQKSATEEKTIEQNGENAIMASASQFQKDLLQNIELLWEEHRQLRQEVSNLTKQLDAKTKDYNELKVKHDKLQIDYDHLRAEHAESTRRENRLIETVSELQLKIISLQKQSLPR